MNFDKEEMVRLCNIFDQNGDGVIDYDEFLYGIRGEMNQFRKDICMKAFKVMDKDRSGVIDISDIKGVYNAKKHPDVIAGKKTEDEVLIEFLDTFDVHHGIHKDDPKDGNVTPDEWIEYYNTVSMSIDDDAYFELMMNNTWNLDNSRVTRKGWSALN
jgi:hypothetical protein